MYRPNGMDTKCSKCSLSTGKAVHGQASVPLDKVLLIFIFAYPNTEEVKQGIVLAPSQKFMNAGRYARSAINSVFGSNFSDHVFFTNAIRCSPIVKKDKKDITNDHLGKCRSWLDLEMKSLPSDVPILIAGTEPVKSLLGFKESIYSNRRKIFNLNGHPSVVTINPIEPSRYHPYDIEISVTKGGKYRIKKKSMLKPTLLSPPYLFKQDLLLIKESVDKYMKDHDITL